MFSLLTTWKKNENRSSELKEMNCLRYVIFFSLLFSWLAVPGYCYEASVSINQVGSPQEPFDVGKSVIYDVQISGASNSMRYTVELTVGPDADSSISKTFKKDINANEGDNAVSIPVNFEATEFLGGEFGRWLNDQNRTESWDKAWYKVIVTSLNPFEEPSEVEDHSGKPGLVKFMEEFRDLQVSPRKGTNEDRYEYQVSVLSTVQDDIALEVSPSRSSPWIKVGTMSYTTPGSWQILKWSNVTLGFDFTSAAYRIIGRKQIASDGPSWPVDVEFDNSSVDPERGLSKTPFAYKIRVKSAKAVDVGLHVWDVTNKRYNSAGRQSYDNASQWSTLVWKDVRPSSAAESSGLSNYYFSFYYPGSDNPFITTYEKNGRYFSGPTLTIVSLDNCTVNPNSGSIFTPYNYSIRLETMLPSCDIELQTAPPNDDIWTAKGTASYNGTNSTLSWENVSFDPNNDAVGNASYRFLLGDTVLGKFIGPEIDVAFKDMVYSRIGNTDRFDYKVKVRSSRPDIKIELIYTDDGLVWTRSRQIQGYGFNSSEWRELLWRNHPWHKTIKFDVVRS